MAKKQVVRERPEGLDKPWVKPFMNRMTKANVWVYQKTNGLIGSKWRVGAAFPQGVPVCLLTTTGRKSGEERVVPLLYLMEGESVVVVASTGGMPKNPAWFFNIKDNPECEVQVMARSGVPGPASPTPPSARSCGPSWWSSTSTTTTTSAGPTA